MIQQTSLFIFILFWFQFQLLVLTSAMGDFNGYRMRSPFARAVLARLQEDSEHRNNKHEHVMIG